MLLSLLRRQILKDRSMNRRSYHRSAVMAFPKTVEYANPIEGPQGPGRSLWLAKVGCVVFWFLLYLVLKP